jgi:hypothetical protein
VCNDSTPSRQSRTSRSLSGAHFAEFGPAAHPRPRLVSFTLSGRAPWPPCRGVLRGEKSWGVGSAGCVVDGPEDVAGVRPGDDEGVHVSRLFQRDEADTCTLLRAVDGGGKFTTRGAPDPGLTGSPSNTVVAATGAERLSSKASRVYPTSASGREHGGPSRACTPGVSGAALAGIGPRCPILR